MRAAGANRRGPRRRRRATFCARSPGPAAWTAADPSTEQLDADRASALVRVVADGHRQAQRLGASTWHAPTCGWAIAGRVICPALHARFTDIARALGSDELRRAAAVVRAGARSPRCTASRPTQVTAEQLRLRPATAVARRVRAPRHARGRPQPAPRLLPAAAHAVPRRA